MKHLMLAATLVASAAFRGKAQNAAPFSGSIAYRMEVSNLPAGVSQAMVDQMVPSKMHIYVKNQQTATTINAGPFQRILMNAKGDTSFMIMNNSKRIFTMTEKEAEAATKDAKVTKPDVKKTKATATIAGYPCTLYEISTDVGGQKMKQNVWMTDKLAMPKSKIKSQSMMATDAPGTMMKMTMKQMGMDMTIEATDVSMTAPPDSLFTLPAGYERKAFSQQAIQDAMMGK